MKIKRLLATALFAVSLVSTLAMSASADTLNNNDLTIETINGSDLSADKIEELQSKGITIDNNSIVTLSSFESETRSIDNIGSYITITNEEEGTYQTDIYLYLDENGNSLPIVEETNVQTRTNLKLESDLGKWDGRYSLYGTAVYFKVGGCYYQPYAVGSSYSKKEDCTVSYMNVTFRCDGAVYSYPEYSLITSYYENAISNPISNPNEDQYYYKIDNFGNDKTINVTNGALALNFRITVNGSTKTHSTVFTMIS